MGIEIDPLVESVVRQGAAGRVGAIIAPWIASQPWRGESKHTDNTGGQGRAGLGCVPGYLLAASFARVVYNLCS